ncbi:NtaA/DmoA family FMN-dependent monooxygenase [Streptomyces sp. NBC_00102]|uniref:NtaA/DmoA family FMN-dependent monooxygenase n=1 Tax=Streptomyces sp. NBC_00102 TaxID=2975652 RepID=UPI00225BEE8A|nr:NtaA/DmoA family FMN-dependent monooxygenase [Streptomyces sp. NBC_00102]MCX5401337.1 NtaA/DmoA family FMN-dependent monooxygenase [Streptomyces sp. NBC_00102]
MTKPTEPLRLGLFLRPFGHHVGAAAVSDVLTYPSHVAMYAEYARLAETGHFEFVFLADSLLHTPFPKGDFASQVEPFTALSALAALTSRIGLVGTVSTTYNAPFHIARRLAALDHLSGGRAGWNVVTSRHDSEARNFGLREHPGHGERYAMASEAIEVVRQLWNSWDEDAFSAGRPYGQRFDPAKVRPVDFHGKYFTVAGPLNLPRPPQGSPLVVQAGGSDDGVALGSGQADVVFTAQSDPDEGIGYRRRIREGARVSGRTRAPLVVPGLYVLLGSSADEVRRRSDRLAEFIDYGEELERLSRQHGVTLGEEDLDRPVGELKEILVPTGKGSLWLQAAQIRNALRRGFTLRDYVRDSAERSSHLPLSGTPDHVAEGIISLHRRGFADGLNIKPAVMDVDLPAFIDEVVPLLRRAGLRPEGYAGTTLRGNLGVPAAPAIPHGGAAAGSAAGDSIDRSGDS